MKRSEEARALLLGFTCQNCINYRFVLHIEYQEDEKNCWACIRQRWIKKNQIPFYSLNDSAYNNSKNFEDTFYYANRSICRYFKEKI